MEERAGHWRRRASEVRAKQSPAPWQRSKRCNGAMRFQCGPTSTCVSIPPICTVLHLGLSLRAVLFSTCCPLWSCSPATHAGTQPTTVNALMPLYLQTTALGQSRAGLLLLSFHALLVHAGMHAARACSWHVQLWEAAHSRAPLLQPTLWLSTVGSGLSHGTFQASPVPSPSCALTA